MASERVAVPCGTLHLRQLDCVLLAGQGGGRGRQGPRFSIRWIIGIFFLTLGDDDIDKGCENS